MRGVDDLTAKEYLNQAKTLDVLINSKQNELYKLRLMAESISSSKFSDKVKSGGQNQAMSVVDKIIDLQQQINAEIDRLVDLKAEIHSKIEKVYNPQFIALLTDKYLNGYTLEQIGERMGKSYETIRIWHGQALQVFRKENGMT